MEELLIVLRTLIEQERTEASTLANLKIRAKNFFQRYWHYIIMFLFAFGLIGFYSYKKISLKILMGKIDKMKVEKEVLLGLMKKVQTERFKENKIPESIYNIKMKKYQDRMNQIKKQLPVLEARLEKGKKTKEI